MMKKYIAPAANCIAVSFEENILLGGSNNEGDDADLSNKRQPSASSAIWGFDDEAQ